MIIVSQIHSMLDKPIIILSKPKSGTYLASEILTQMGLEQTYMHLSERSYTQYDKNKILDGRKNPGKYLRNEGLKISTTKVRPNAFCVGHIDYNKGNIGYLQGFFKIVLTRDEQERKQSWERFYNGKVRRKQHFGTGVNKGDNISKWADGPDAFVIDFHDMLHKNTVVIDKLQIIIYGRVMHDSNQILQKSLDADTLTKSNMRE